MASSVSVSAEGLKVSKKGKKTTRSATVGPGGGSIGISKGPVQIGVKTDGSIGVKISAGPLSVKGDSKGGFGVETPIGGIDYNSDGSGSITAPLGIAKMEVEKKGCVYIKRTYLAGTLIDTEYQQIEGCKEDPPDPPDPDDPKHPPPPGEDDQGWPILPPPFTPPPPAPGNPEDSVYFIWAGMAVGGYTYPLPGKYTVTWSYTPSMNDDKTFKMSGFKKVKYDYYGETGAGSIIIDEPGNTRYSPDPPTATADRLMGGTADIRAYGNHWRGFRWEWDQVYTGPESYTQNEGNGYIWTNTAAIVILYAEINNKPVNISPPPPELPIEKPPPPPPIMSNCCKNQSVDIARLEEAIERLEQVIGTREILNDPQGYAVPNKMLIPGGEGYSFSKNYLNIFTWLFAAIDRYGFDGPIIVDIADVDKGKAGNQSLQMQVNSLSTAIQTLLSLAVENKGDQATRLNIQIRLAFMLTRLMRMMHKMYYLVVAILEGLGIPTIKKYIKNIPFEFNLNPEDLGFGKKAEQLDTMSEDDLEAQLPKILDTKEMDLIVEQFKPNQLDLRGFLLKLINKK